MSLIYLFQRAEDDGQSYRHPRTQNNWLWENCDEEMCSRRSATKQSKETMEIRNEVMLRLCIKQNKNYAYKVLTKHGALCGLMYEMIK